MNGSAPPPIPTAATTLRSTIPPQQGSVGRQGGSAPTARSPTHAVGCPVPQSGARANHRLNGRGAATHPTLERRREGRRGLPTATPQDPNPPTHASGGGGAHRITHGAGQWPAAAVCRARQGQDPSSRARRQAAETRRGDPCRPTQCSTAPRT